ncbi:uncharacterized protein LOC119640525 [Glossina fuscipes]|uniref:Uncharacterized protein LOC119640525 n=1 Tax=Glossina fuscipes TaxID=7396 RepID=A0A9C5ZEA3_9MUSC|nr:uncharacterized protein LOC119640525 [Glossina fuscipes]
MKIAQLNCRDKLKQLEKYLHCNNMPCVSETSLMSHDSFSIKNYNVGSSETNPCSATATTYRTIISREFEAGNNPFAVNRNRRRKQLPPQTLHRHQQHQVMLKIVRGFSAGCA